MLRSSCFEVGNTMYTSYPSWWMKASPRRRRSLGRKKFRWEVLGLPDYAKTLCTPSIEDIRRQIISASHHGLSFDTLARSDKKQKRANPRPKAKHHS